MKTKTELLVSVIVPVRNGENCVGRCIESILKQTYEDFELIMVDDASSDRTGEIIKGFRDKRIKCLKNKEWCGIATTRNIGIEQASGKYVFFTDADCVVNAEWIEEGLSCLQTGFVGAEGKIIYVSENYHRAFSDYVMENRFGGKFMTGNIAYLRDIVLAAGGLNESLTYLSDRALGLEVSKKGNICFNERMVAIHPWVQMTKERVFKAVSSVEDRIFLFKTYNDREMMTWRVMDINHFALLLCPALIFASFLLHTYKKSTDYRLLPITYVSAILERVHIWRASVKNHVFVI